PTFRFSVNRPEGVGEAYQRYLENRLHEAFGFDGVPLRLRFASSRGGPKRPKR
ncbi:MAG: ribosome biogenesis GTPase Der, partial [Deltaproteobacteria bacterium]